MDKKLLIVILFSLMFVISGCEENYVGKRIPQEDPGDPDEWTTPSIYNLEVGESTLGVELMDMGFGARKGPHYCILSYNGEIYTIYEESIETLDDGKIIGVFEVEWDEPNSCVVVLEHENSAQRIYADEIYAGVEVEEVHHSIGCGVSHYAEGDLYLDQNSMKSFEWGFPDGRPTIMTLLSADEFGEENPYCDVIIFGGMEPTPRIEYLTLNGQFSLNTNWGGNSGISSAGFSPFIIDFSVSTHLSGYNNEEHLLNLDFGNGDFEIFSLGEGLNEYTTTYEYSGEGFYQVRAQIINSNTEEVVDSTPYYIIASLPDTQTPFSEELEVEGNYIIINDNRFFPIGAFNLYPWGDYPYEQEIDFEDWGFNIALINMRKIFGFPEEMYKFYTSEAAGINSLHEYSFYSEDELILSSSIPESGKIIGWWNKDEPVWLGYDIGPIAEAYNLIKQTNPTRPVWMNFAPAHQSDNIEEYISDIGEFSQYADIISVDVYPAHSPCEEDYAYCILENPEISVIGDFVDLYKQQIVSNKPFWIFLQGHGDTLTYNQLRFMTYQSIIHGATGIFYYFWFGFEGERYTEDLRLTTNQLQELHDVITTHYEERQINTQDGIEYLKIFHDNQLYIISVNRNNQVTQKTFNIDSTNTPITVLYEDRTLTTNNQGEFTDTFQPFDTHIYKTSLSCGWGNFGEPSCHANDISSQNNRNSCRNNIGCYPDSITDRDCVLDENYCRNQVGPWKCQSRSCELQ